MNVDVVDLRRAKPVPPEPIRRFVRRLARLAPARGAESVAVCFVSDPAMRRLNARWRGKRKTTDVLSFEGLGRGFPGPGRHLGDIVISVPRAARQAREAGYALDRELRLLVIHGWLHLLGHDHETDDGTMLRIQGRLVSRLLGRRAAR